MVNPRSDCSLDARPAMVNFSLPRALFRRFSRTTRAALPIIKVNSAKMRGMDIRSIPLFEAITRRMAWLTDRQTVLAENVANANTPGYLEKDLKEPDFRGVLARAGGSSILQIAATQPGHITTKPDAEIIGTVD